jgi:hypothetical protein
VALRWTCDDEQAGAVLLVVPGEPGTPNTVDAVGPTPRRAAPRRAGYPTVVNPAEKGEMP